MAQKHHSVLFQETWKCTLAFRLIIFTASIVPLRERWIWNGYFKQKDVFVVIR